MAIRFVDKTPATTEADTPADAAAHDPQAPAVGPDAAEPGACKPIASPRPKPRRRKADAHADAEPAPAGPEGGDADAAEAPKGPEAASAALPGFEDSPKPKRRRGAARPYWGFG